MRQDQVVIGATYAVKVSGKVVPVRIVEAYRFGGWIGRNMLTGREIHVRTAARLRYRIPDEHLQAYVSTSLSD